MKFIVLYFNPLTHSNCTMDLQEMNIIAAAARYGGSIFHLGMGYRNYCFHIQI